MSSIEKFVNKLDKLTGSSAAPKNAGRKEPQVTFDGPSVMPVGAPEIARSPVVTSTEVTISFEYLENSGLLSPDKTFSRISEEFRVIKRPLLNNASAQNKESNPNANLIMVTSGVPGEGKSFTSINLAISMALELDRTVLLVEADVARPTVCKYLGLREQRKGLVDYLTPGSELNLPDLLLKTNIPKFTILPAGSQHPHSAELLASDAMKSLMTELATRYEDRIVIFDSPPLLLSSEAVLLATMVGQVVLVVESEKTQQSIVSDALALLDPNQIVGVVMNKSLVNDDATYGVYGGYGYGGKRED